MNIKPIQSNCGNVNYGAGSFTPVGGTFSCPTCPANTLTGSSINFNNLTAPTVVTYTLPNTCSVSFTASKKPTCNKSSMPCPGFTITNANNICIFNNQNTSDVVAYNLDGTGCPPAGAIYKAEMIPSSTTSWANPIVIGQTTNNLIDLPITIQGTQASGNYSVRVAIYTATGVFIEASINTKSIQIGRPTTTVLGYTCTFSTCTTCGGGSGSGTGRTAPTNNFADNEVYLYPNPTADRFTLQTPEYDAATGVSISDTQGRLISKR